MQRGTIRAVHGSWFLYYRESGKKVCRRLGIMEKGARSIPAHIRTQADEILKPINLQSQVPEAAMPLKLFIDHHYLPAAKLKLRASTYHEYDQIFKLHITPKISDRTRISDFTTPMAQALLDDVLTAHPDLTHQRMLRIRASLSAVFSHAARRGILHTVNPVHATRVGGNRKKFRGATYTLEEIYRQMNLLRQQSGGAYRATLIAVFAFLGLRASEVRGLRWEDFTGENINVKRAVWRRHVGPTKTAESEDAVPVISVLQNLLRLHREELRAQKNMSSSDSDFIFSGLKTKRTGMPINLNNFARRYIIPVFKEVKPPLVWKGWTAYRRSLASTLYGMSVPPKVIARILRHSSVLTTMTYYVQTQDSESQDAMKKIQDRMAELHKVSGGS